MIDKDVEIETSTLSRKIQCEGVEIDVLIYRIKGSDEGWTLEVVDEENASTVWDEPFDTDQAAFDEFMRVLEEEGISEFLRPEFARMH